MQRVAASGWLSVLPSQLVEVHFVEDIKHWLHSLPDDRNSPQQFHSGISAKSI
jgi:hypothetical protein